MGKVVDITEKLAFDENPVIKIKDEEFEVNADAETVLLVMGILGEELGPKNVLEMYNLIFGENARNRIKELRLQYKDFQTMVMKAVDLIIGNDEEEGE